MKNIKKFISLALALLICLTAVGCSDDGGSKQVDNKDDENVKVVRIAKAAYHEELDSWNEDDEYGQAIRNMLAEIEGEENIKIQIDYYNPTELTKLAKTAITNGDTSFADIFILKLFNFGPLYAQGLFLDSSELPGLDVTSENWSQAFTELATFGGKTYGVASPGLTGSGLTGTGMLYNKTLGESLGIEDPIQLARDGKWTWDKLRELSLKAAKDLDNDGKFTDADRYGCTSESWDGIVPKFFTAGVPSMIREEDGSLTYNFLSAEANKVALKFHSTFTTSDGMFYAAGYDGLKQTNHFAAGKVLFHFGGFMKEADTTTDEIVPLPNPKYSVDDEYVSTTWHNTDIIAVPMIAEDKELIGKVLQMLADKSADFIQYIRNDSAVRYVDRDLAIEMSNLSTKFVVDPCTLVIECNENLSIGTMRAVGSYILDGKTTFSQLTNAYAKSIQSLLDEMFNPK